MNVLYGLTDPAAYRGGFVSIGNFDGLHLGHQSMLTTLRARAQEKKVPSVVFTFDPHPISVLRPEHAPPALMTLTRKLELLASCGVDCTLVYPTDSWLLSLPPQQFFTEIVQNRIGAVGLVEGPNFYYGKERTGSVETLRKSCHDAGLTLEVIPPVSVAGRLVSSSTIRGLIAGGDVETAGQLLGRPFELQGTVAHGAKRGRTIGFPTANLEGIETLIPPDGVYGGIAIHLGERIPAAINLGPNPTFAEQRQKCEVHLLDYSGDLYGDELLIEFHARLRDTVRFAGVEQLVAQLSEDVAQVRTLANKVEAG